MSDNHDRTEEMSRAVARPEDGVEIAGGGLGEDERKLNTVAEKVVPAVVEKPRSCSSQDANDITPDQVQAAVARGSLTVSQMQRRLGGAPLSNKELLR